MTISRGKFSGSSVTFDLSNSSNTLVLPFNPTEYSIEDKSNFSEAAVPGLASPIIQYSSGDARVLSLEVLLDSYAYDKSQDIRELYLTKIDQFSAIDGDLHAPAPCQVTWGSLQFVGLLESVRKQFVLFSEDGKPVRARVTFSFREYIPVEVQVRQTQRSSADKFKSRTVKDGESLWQISAEVYGDSRLWRVLANANRLDDPLRLHTGDLLLIPALQNPGGEGSNGG
jgi:hypothetical protein